MSAPESHAAAPTTADVLTGLEATRKADQVARDRRALGGVQREGER